MAGILLILLACVFWGIDTLIRYPLVDRGVDPLLIVFYEHVVLALIFSTQLLRGLRQTGELRLTELGSFFVVGGLGSGMATVAFTWAFQYLNPSMVILLQKLQPVVAITLASIILHEEVHKQFLIWAGVCLLGGLLVSSPDIERFYLLIQKDFSVVISDAALKGYGLVGLSILGWGSATVYGKKLSMEGFDTKQILGGRFLFGLMVIAPFMRWDNTQLMLLPEANDYVRVGIMVIISGALAMYCYYQGMKRLEAKKVAIAEMFFPFFAIIANWIFLGKQLTELQLLGGALLAFGSLVIQLKKY